MIRKLFILLCFMLLGLTTYTYSYSQLKDSIIVHSKDSIIFHIIGKDTICIAPKAIKRTIFKLDTLVDRIYADTVKCQYIKIDTTKSKKHISNIIVSNFFNANTSKITNKLQEIVKYNKYEGMIIDSIIINRNNIFSPKLDDNSTEAKWKRKANLIHVVTKESTIRNDMLFKVGDKVIPENIIKSEAILRDANYISKASITIIPQENGHVKIFVDTDDTWSLTAQIYYRVTNNGKIRISEENFLGSGNRLDLNEYFNLKNSQYFKALELNYYMPNLFGKFVETNVGAGYGTDFLSLLVAADKYFVKPDDWAGGIRYDRLKEDHHINIENIFIVEDKEVVNLWFGQSINISPKWGDNFYYAIKVENIKFRERPYISPTYNPYFHNSTDFIWAFGFYKEKFYRGNLIYGYGKTESIPYGYKAEIVGGYRIGEFENTPYIGTNLSISNKMDIGYVSASFSFGTFISGNSVKQAKLDANLFYFTRLTDVRNGVKMRQFVTINYATGINLLDGYSEEIHFENNNMLSSVSRGASGTTQLRVNPESTFFTPLQVSGFKFAFFGFTDFGTIGYSTNPFENKFYASAGVGVRVRNESLIFKTIQIRLIVAIKGHRQFRNNLFYINSETPLRGNSYIPTEPEFIQLRD